MLLLAVVLSILKYQSVQVTGLFYCKENTVIYQLEKHLVEIEHSRNPTRTQITACKADETTKPVEFDPERLLKGVSTLWTSGISWPSSLPTSLLEEVVMFSMPYIGLWEDCSRLVHIRVVKSNIAYHPPVMIPPDWLKNCTQLRSLHFEDVSVTEIRNILHTAPHNVTSLKLIHIVDLFKITQYPLFSSTNNLKIKYFSVGILSYNSDPPTNISWREISSSLMWQLSLLSHLESVFILGGHNFDMCASGNSRPVLLRSLKSLELVNTNTPRLCFGNYYHAPQLNTILLSFNSQAQSPGFHMQVREMFSRRAPQLYVDLFNQGQVLSFDFTREDYLELYDFQNQITKKANVQLLGFQQLIKCDCYGPSAWFARALRAGLVMAPGVLCADFTPPADMICDWLDCERIYCNSTCICCREEQYGIRVDCRDTNIMAIPEELLHFPNLTKLVAPNNNILTLPDYLPDSLLFLDVKENNVWQAGTSHVGSLFSQPRRRVRVGRNYLLCSCENMQLIAQLHDHKHQVEDFTSITCAISNVKLQDINVAQLCAARDRDKQLIKQRDTILVAVIVSLIAAVVCLVIAFALYQRRRQIQIFLFARGWCLNCITEEELDADRLYDVFISFCHADTAFVSEQLLPPLDREYSVCVHLRDWIPGEMIPTQIMKSVEQSRRTIVVMSRNFIRSVWGRLEFQTAHVNGLADGRVRVVMIILDDVLEKDELTPELRSYVRLNTYVRWSDPWFWEKLRYALPHYPSPRVRLWRSSTHLQIEYDSREPNIEMMRIERPELQHREIVESEPHGIEEEIE